jgi:hypothetical protein
MQAGPMQCITRTARDGGTRSQHRGRTHEDVSFTLFTLHPPLPPLADRRIARRRTTLATVPLRGEHARLCSVICLASPATPCCGAAADVCHARAARLRRTRAQHETRRTLQQRDRGAEMLRRSLEAQFCLLRAWLTPDFHRTARACRVS